MHIGLIPVVTAAALALTLTACQKRAEDSPALQLVAKEFASEPTFSNVVTRKDAVGRTVVCGTAAGTMNVPVPVKANEPPRTEPLTTPTQVTTRFYVAENEAVIEHQNSLYTGADPSVKASADEYQLLTEQWFRVGWDLLCTDQPAAPKPAQ